MTFGDWCGWAYSAYLKLDTLVLGLGFSLDAVPLCLRRVDRFVLMQVISFMLRLSFCLLSAEATCLFLYTVLWYALQMACVTLTTAVCAKQVVTSKNCSTVPSLWLRSCHRWLVHSSWQSTDSVVRIVLRYNCIICGGEWTHHTGLAVNGLKPVLLC